MMTDVISDLFSRIQNAQAVKLENTVAPYSKLKEDILKILEKEGYIASFRTRTEKKRKYLDIKLKYLDKLPVIKKIKRISKPGRRIYANSKNIPRSWSGMGIVIVSTSKGVMTGRAARKLGVGGEVIGEVL